MRVFDEGYSRNALFPLSWISIIITDIISFKIT